MFVMTAKLNKKKLTAVLLTVILLIVAIVVLLNVVGGSSSEKIQYPLLSVRKQNGYGRRRQRFCNAPIKKKFQR